MNDIQSMTTRDLLELGVQRGRSGDFVGARECFSRVLQNDSENVDALYLQSVNFVHSGNSSEAISLLRKLLSLQPNNAHAYNYLGMALQHEKNPEAYDCFKEACLLKPDFVEAHFNLGQAFYYLGKPQAAERSLREALRLQPDFLPALNRLGDVYLAVNRLSHAAGSYRRFLSLQPNAPDVHRKLGEVYFKQGNLQESKREFEFAIRLRPDLAETHYFLAETLKSQKDFAAAEAEYRRAIELNPDYGKAFNNLGTMLLLLEHRLEDAVDCFENALRFESDDVAAHANLGSAMLTLGKPDEARAHFQSALQQDPKCLEALASAANNNLFPLEPGQIEFLQDELQSGRLNPIDSSMLYFALGSIKHREKSFDEAFDYFKSGNATRKKVFVDNASAFIANDHRAFVQRLIATFSSDYFAELPSVNSSSELPVFVVGMPRSGTSLIEQIMACHSRVFGAGELTCIGPLSDDLTKMLATSDAYPECLLSSERWVATTLAEKHLAHLQTFDENALRVVDKMPMNFIHLGLIATLFPGARIIHCRRDPMDVCFSCYMQWFRSLNFAWDLQDLGEFHKDYQVLMEHWQKVLPLQMLDVQYEHVVNEQESVSRDVIEFLGLDWEDACLDFHENHRAVLTASKLQVRQPVYKSAIGRWRNYERHLQPLIESLKTD